MSSNSVYTQYNNVSKSDQFLVHLGSLINAMFCGLDLRYYISIIIIYNVRDPTTMDNYALPGSPFHNHYVPNIYTPLQPQSALIVVRNEPHELTFKPLYGLCNSNNLIMLGILSRPYLLLSIIATQLIVRTYGLYYDEVICVCQRRATCIMYRYPVLTDSFSYCSFVHVLHISSFSGTHCSYMTEIEYLNRSLTFAQCRNCGG